VDAAKVGGGVRFLYLPLGMRTAPTCKQKRDEECEPKHMEAVSYLSDGRCFVGNEPGASTNDPTSTSDGPWASTLERNILTLVMLESWQNGKSKSVTVFIKSFRSGTGPNHSL
jgi:hypothetical protein